MLIFENAHRGVLGELLRVVGGALAFQHHDVAIRSHRQIPHAPVQARFDPLLNGNLQRLLLRRRDRPRPRRKSLPLSSASGSDAIVQQPNGHGMHRVEQSAATSGESHEPIQIVDGRHVAWAVHPWRCSNRELNRKSPAPTEYRAFLIQAKSQRGPSLAIRKKSRSVLARAIWPVEPIYASPTANVNRNS